MTIAAVGIGPLGLPRGEFSGSAAVVETQRILLRLAAADPQADILTLYEASCTCRKMGFWEKRPVSALASFAAAGPFFVNRRRLS